MSNGPSTLYFTGTQLLAVPDLCDTDTRDEGQLAEANEAAAYACELVYILTGRQFPGHATATVYPQRRHHQHYGRFGPSLSLLGALGIGGVEHHALDAIWLHDPIVSINEVLIDGVVLDPATYRTRNHCEIVRVDGGHWPHTNHTTFNAFSINYTFGAESPYALFAASRELAIELWKADHNQQSKLPVGTTSASRQGTSITVQRDVDAIRTSGPALEKLWHAIAAFNPTGQRQPSMIHTPDNPWVLNVYDELVEGS